MIQHGMPRSSRAMPSDSSAGPPAPPGAGSWGCSGGPLQPGWGRCIPPMRETSHPRAFALHGLPSSQSKSWDEEDQHLGASRGLPSPAPTLLHGGTCLRMVGCRGSVPCTTPRHPPTPKAFFLTIWERISLERNKSQRHDYFSSRKWLRDSAQEQDLQSRDAQLPDLQYFSYTFSPLSYWFHNTPALLFHLPLSSRL